MHTICFGSSREHFKILLPSEITNQSWAKVQISIAVEGFTGDISALIDKDDFVVFAKQLTELNKTLAGVATLEPLDRQISLQMSADARGHVKLEGELSSRTTHGNKLIYDFDLDQTYLREPLAQLEHALTVWASE